MTHNQSQPRTCGVPIGESSPWWVAAIAWSTMLVFIIGLVWFWAVVSIATEGPQ